jgi:hypothetical protein
MENTDRMSRRGTTSAVIGRLISRGLVGLAVVLAVLALALSYLGRAVLEPGPFADRAVATLRDPAVRADVADRLTNVIVRSGGGDLVSLRPLIRVVAGAVIGHSAFDALFRRAVLTAHAAVVDRSGSRILVSVGDAGVLLQGALKRFAPAAARRIGAERISTVLNVAPGDGVLDVVRAAKRIHSAAWILAVLALLAAAGAVLTSPTKGRTIRNVGIGLLAGGLTIVALLTLGRAIVVQAAPTGRGAAAGALWAAFLDGLRVQALLLAGAGAICAAAASGCLRSAGQLAQGWRLLIPGATRPERRFAPAVGLIAGGVVMILEPAAMLTIAVQATGLLIVYVGLRALLDAAESAIRRPKLRWPGWMRRTGPLAWVALGIAALAGAAAVIAGGGGDEAPPATPLTCNGYVELCNQPLNDVALAATHNSMASVTSPHWLFGQQDGTIKDQLNFGIRGFLIDTYYGVAVPGGVRTDLKTLPKRELAEREIGAPAVAAAERLRSRVGYQGTGKPGIFLCHGFCELGAESLDSALADLRSFLVSNPGEVVVVINQDEGVSPTDIERAFDKAGLLDLIYRGAPGPFPTLRSMIDSNQRLVVLAENDAGSVPWYHLAYDHALQETPFKFTNAGQLTDASKLAASCRPNRGPASAPLFLVNNWVDTSPTPRPSLAATVNASAALLRRAEDCERIRNRLPNLLAVDFFRRGDVLGVVDKLNGVGR